MSTYAHADFERIAIAIGMEVGQIAQHANLFEAAARWYRLDKKRPRHIAPYKLQRRLDQIGKNARRLLKSLGVNSADEAADGPGDPEILDALVLADEPNERPVIEATQRIGRLVEIIDGTAAAAEFDRRAKVAAIEAAEFGKLTVPEGHPGEAVLNDWIAEMMSAYRSITGKGPATSVDVAGVAAGPLIRFLKAAGKPLGIECDEDALRSRVRTILKGASRQN